jgi:hypothetical protein
MLLTHTFCVPLTDERCRSMRKLLPRMELGGYASAILHPLMKVRLLCFQCVRVCYVFQCAGWLGCLVLRSCVGHCSTEQNTQCVQGTGQATQCVRRALYKLRGAEYLFVGGNVCALLHTRAHTLDMSCSALRRTQLCLRKKHCVCVCVCVCVQGTE